MNAHEILNIGSNKLKSKNIQTHKIDSEILLSKVLKSNREKILINLDQTISQNQIKEYKKLIYRRSINEPIAYITQEKEFWSKSFYVNENTLIPRPETELLVENVSKIFKKKSIFILDIGTGSGCILISLLYEMKNSRGVGVDISKKALKIAGINAKKHYLTNRIKLYKKSFCQIFNKKFDLVVSNPPYVKSIDIKNLARDVRGYEPKIALDGGNDGLDLIKKVIYKTTDILKIKGTFALEIGNKQYKQVSKILFSKNFRIEKVVNDYKENTRCIISRLEK